MDVGGQAVVEGVMMRNKDKYAVAVRLPNGKIKIMKEKNSGYPNLFKIFFIRGILGLGYTLYDGIRALIWSSNQNLGKEEKLTKKEIVGTIVVSMFFAILIFFVLPFVSAMLINANGTEGVMFDLIDGFFRISLFLGYLVGISYLKDVKTMFRYHGAEHKVIRCYENKKKLTVANVKKFSRFHPRCGTSFLFIVLLISILIFTLISGPWWIKLLGRIALLPVIAGIGYEIIKLSGRYRHNPLIKLLIAPGLWLQRITTKEPSDQQIKVGIASLKAVIG